MWPITNSDVYQSYMYRNLWLEHAWWALSKEQQWKKKGKLEFMKFVQKDIEEEIISCIFKRVKHIWLLYKWIYGYQCNRMLRILTHILTMSTLPHGHEKKGILLKKKKKEKGVICTTMVLFKTNHVVDNDISHKVHWENLSGPKWAWKILAWPKGNDFLNTSASADWFAFHGCSHLLLNQNINNWLLAISCLKLMRTPYVPFMPYLVYLPNLVQADI